MNAIVESTLFLILSIALLVSIAVLCWILIVQLVKTNRMVNTMKTNPELTTKVLTSKQFKTLAVSTLTAFILRFLCMLLFHVYLRALPSGVYSGNSYSFVFEMLIYKYPYFVLFLVCIFALYQIRANLKTIKNRIGEV